MSNNNLPEPREERMRRRLNNFRDISPDCMEGILKLEMVSCGAEQDTCVFRVKTHPWMRNRAGTLHGGIGAAILDYTMGMMLYCIRDNDTFCPTVEMQASYHRPLIPGKEILSRVRIVSKTRRLAHMAAEVYHADAPEQVCVSGTSIYFLTE